MVNWSIHPSNGLGTFPKFVVPSAQAVFAGHWDRESRTLVAPDNDAIRAALPYRLRAAFERARGAAKCGGFWFGGNSLGGPIRQQAGHMELRGYRGKHLATLYAIPVKEGSEQ